MRLDGKHVEGADRLIVLADLSPGQEGHRQAADGRRHPNGHTDEQGLALLEDPQRLERMYDGQVPIDAQAGDKIDTAVIAGVINGPGYFTDGVAEDPVEVVEVVVDQAREAKDPSDVGEDQVEEEDGASVPTFDPSDQDPHDGEVQGQSHQEDEEEGEGEDNSLDSPKEGARLLTKVIFYPLRKEIKRTFSWVNRKLSE